MGKCREIRARTSGNPVPERRGPFTKHTLRACARVAAHGKPPVSLEMAGPAGRHGIERRKHRIPFFGGIISRPRPQNRGAIQIPFAGLPTPL